MSTQRTIKVKKLRVANPNYNPKGGAARSWQ